MILKALSADQQLQLLTALRAGRKPPNKLPEPLHGAQLKLYQATRLDPDFLAAEKRVRTAVIGDLTQPGPTLNWLIGAWKTWPTLPLTERMPVLRRIVNLHCQRAHFPPPLSIDAAYFRDELWRAGYRKREKSTSTWPHRHSLISRR